MRFVRISAASFSALLLERLQAINPRGFVRIGLSATQRPLDEVARFLGGAEADAEGRLIPRPVAVVDAGLRKNLDLRILSPVEAFGPLPEGSVWPPIYRLLSELIREHRSTIVFTNDRRSAERITAFLNDEGEIARADHGSVALEVRQQVEAALKEGRLPAVVATASLELGIDMGAVDLVCQVGSPGNVARALQRVGRAGHLVGQTSKGRLIPKTPGELLEQAVLAREMMPAASRRSGRRSTVWMFWRSNSSPWPRWTIGPCRNLYALVRRAYSYRDLSPQAFEATLEMISGRYRFAEPSASGGRKPADLHSVEDGETNQGAYAPRSPARAIEALQPRVSWDRVHNRLLALPGSLHTALINGGVIPDVGQYAAYTNNGVRIGELDEEFIYESRVGDAFLLGTNAWRLERIEADRVVVAPAEGAPAAAPFWRGEGGGRTYDLGLAIGAFLREMKERIDAPDLLDWLQRECFLDASAARNLRHYVNRQLIASGSLPTDLTLQIEASRDQLGDWQVVVLSPLGSRLHLTLRLALEARLRQRLGYHPQCMHHSDGVLLRFTDMAEPLLDLFDGLAPENVEGFILDELADSPLFALRFRQNAARALLMPRGQPGRRAPLWLQRLRGRDLLQVCRRHADFPVIAETFRECLHDHLDVPHLQQLLSDIRAGRVEVKTRRAESPSAFASGLLFSFTVGYMYSYDRPEGEGGGAGGLDKRLIGTTRSAGAAGASARSAAIHQVERRLRGLGQPPRSATEAAEWLRRLGDLSPSELEGPMALFLQELEADGRARRIELPPCPEPTRWVAVEDELCYRRAFGLEPAEPEQARAAATAIFERFLTTHALVGLADVLNRYPFDPQWAQQQLEEWARAGRATAVRRDDAGPLQWSAPENLEQVQRGSLSLLRREVTACPPQQFADFLLRWQGVHPSTQKGGAEGLSEAMERLQGLALSTELWEQTVLPARVPGYQLRWLDEWIGGGAGLWIGRNDGHGTGSVSFVGREMVREWPSPADSDLPPLGDDALLILEQLRQRGASFLTDLAMELDRSPGACRTALWSLAHRGLVTNDRFDAARQGDDAPAPALAASFGALPRLPSLRSLRRRAGLSPEGRWSIVPWGRPEPEAYAVAQAALLLQRYGIVAHEMALLDAQALPWRVLYEVLSRMELVGDVRRGYFVEGLSGASVCLAGSGATAARPLLALHRRRAGGAVAQPRPCQSLWFRRPIRHTAA